ncbi:MAG: polysaccharide deacetylase family protein [Bacteroidota bacterium]
MYLKKIPALLQKQLPEVQWRVDTHDPVLYLTFDDGPTPEITEWVLAQLAECEAKATFFCIGKNVRQHPHITHQILDQGHSIGNHTEHHLNGWRTAHKIYLRDILQAQQTIQEYTGTRTRLYRPPYGRMSMPQIHDVKRSHHIVMMDVISGDFDLKRNASDCAQTVIRYAKPGSIVLFHDSVKVWSRLEGALPKVLTHFADQGYCFKALRHEWREELLLT